MAKEKITEFNILDHLTDGDKISGFLEASLEEAEAAGDYSAFIAAIGDAARAHGINSMAKKMGVNRESLYKSFNGRTRPNFETIFKTLRELGIRVSFSPAPPPLQKQGGIKLVGAKRSA